MHASALVTLYGICATILVTFYATYEWLAPGTPVVIGLVGVFVPSLILMYALESDARPPKPNVMLWLSTLILASVFGIAIPGLWSIGSVRANLLTKMPSLRSVQLAAKDADPRVQDSACQMLFDDRVEVLPSEAAAILASSPTASSHCLRNVPESSMRAEVVKDVAVEWHGLLLEGTAAHCPAAMAIDALPIAAPNRVGFLLDCALGGNAETRTCCADQLKASYPGMDFVNETRRAGPVLRQLNASARLLGASFDEKAFVESVAPVVDSLGLQTNDMRQIALDSACTAVTEEVGRPDDMRYLEWLFGEHTACLDDPNGRTDVVAGCALILDMTPAQRANLGAAICGANQQVRTTKAAAAAAFKTGAAFGSDAEKIDAGRATLMGERLSAQNYEAFAKSGDIANMSPEERAIMMKQIQAQGTPTGAYAPGGMSEAELKRMRENLETPEGTAKEQQKIEAGAPSASDAERVLGISMEDLRKSVGPDGEVSAEMQDRLDKLEEGK